MQADAHPGNILVMKGARIGLIDYGQSKQLPDKERLAFAALLVELAKGRSGYCLALICIAALIVLSCLAR